MSIEHKTKVKEVTHELVQVKGFSMLEKMDFFEEAIVGRVEEFIAIIMSISHERVLQYGSSYYFVSDSYSE